MPFFRLLLVVFYLLGAAMPAHAGEPLKIDGNERRASVRAALLHEAPLGSDSAAVLAMIRKNLLLPSSQPPVLLQHSATGPSAEASQKAGVTSIRIDLADYPNPSLVTLTPLFPFEESLVAQWAFDSHDQLIELFLDRELKK